MISRLHCTIVELCDQSVIADVHGVGYEVMVGPDLLSTLTLKQEVVLYTHLAIRENAHELYGFATREQLEFFKKLLTISGVGPKSALHILSLGPVGELCGAITRGDTEYLTQVAGIGKKTAQRIVVELKGKVDAFVSESTSVPHDDLTALIMALEQMGYRKDEAKAAAVFACEQEGDGTLEVRMRCALSYMSQ